MRTYQIASGAGQDHGTWEGETRIEAWHFLRAGGRLRDGSEPPPDGVVLRHSGPLVLGESGLHASRRALDALGYAPGPVVCRVVLGGQIVWGSDTLAATERTILWRADATEALAAFQRDEARRVLHLWDAPAVVRAYLATGDEALRDAACAAACAAATADQETRLAASLLALAAAR